MYDPIIHSDQMPWKDSDFPGVQQKILNTNPNTGGLTVLTKMGPGTEIPAHHHAIADESVYVLEGDFLEADQKHGAGSFLFAAAGETHGPHRSDGGCIVLTQFSKTLDFVLD